MCSLLGHLLFLVFSVFLALCSLFFVRRSSFSVAHTIPNQHKETSASTDDCDGAEEVFKDMIPQIIVHTSESWLNVPRADVCMRDQKVCTENDCDKTMLRERGFKKNVDEGVIHSHLSVWSVGAPSSAGVPQTSVLLDAKFSSTNSATSPTLSIARFVIVYMGCLQATESFAMASVRGISPCCVHWRPRFELGRRGGTLGRCVGLVVVRAPRLVCAVCHLSATCSRCYFVNDS